MSKYKGRKKSQPWLQNAQCGCRGKVEAPKTTGQIRLKLELPFPAPDCVNLTLKDVDTRCNVTKIKVRIEQEVGILPEMYYLSYLDTVPIEDSCSLRDYDVVHRGTLRVNVWRMWQELLKAALAGNIKDCFACSQNIADTSEWSKHCAWAALYVAAHCGHHNLVAELLKKASPAINFKSPCGWTATHAAARMNRWKVLCMLIDNGADVRITDDNSATAQDLARIFGHKKCENSLRFCQWNLQKHSIVQKRKLDYNAFQDRQLQTRLEHQQVDSTLKVGFRGTHGQIYMAHTLNPVSVAKVKQFQKDKALNPLAKEQLLEKIDEELTCQDEDGKLDFKYGWFDEVRAQQLIPSTRDIIRYSDPSSCQLRPRSLLNPGGYKIRLYTTPPPPPNWSPTPSRGSYTPSSAAHTTLTARSRNNTRLSVPTSTRGGSPGYAYRRSAWTPHSGRGSMLQANL